MLGDERYRRTPSNLPFCRQVSSPDVPSPNMLQELPSCLEITRKFPNNKETCSSFDPNPLIGKWLSDTFGYLHAKIVI